MTKSMKRILSIRINHMPDECANGNPSNYKFCGAAEREAAFERGDFSFIGIAAEALIKVTTSDLTQTIHSGGLWGVETDSKPDYLKRVESDELDELRGHLKALGFSSRAISAAFKNVEHKEAA